MDVESKIVHVSQEIFHGHACFPEEACCLKVERKKEAYPVQAEFLKTMQAVGFKMNGCIDKTKKKLNMFMQRSY